MRRTRFGLIAGLLAGVLAACGGGGGGEGSSVPVATQVLSGVVAGGAPVIGQVTVKDSAGTTRTALIEADGNYQVDGEGLLAPFILRARGTVGGRTIQYHSYAVESDTTAGNTVNITPFTDLIVANAAQQLASEFFDDGTFDSVSEQDIADQETALQAKLQDVLTAAGVGAAVDLLHSAFRADHSGLDLVLDVVRVEVDAATRVATLTNFLDNTSITDDLTDSADVSAPLAVTSDLSTTQTHLQAILARFRALETLFATGLPTTSQLDHFFAADFLNQDQGKSQFLTELSTEVGIVGLTFAHISIEAIDQTPGAETATVTFRVAVNGTTDPEPETWQLAKNGTTWEVRGDRSIVEYYVGFICARSFSADGTDQGQGCGINVDVNDFDPTNNGSGNGLIASARATLHRDDLPVSGSDVFLGVPQFGAAGELRVFDTDYSDDFMGFGSGSDQIDATLFQAGDVLTIELFTGELNTSTPGVIGSPIGSISETVPFAPHANAATAPYPAATTATRTAFASYTGGTLPIGWTLAEGTVIEETLLRVCDDSSCLEVRDEDLSGAAGYLALDLSSLDQAATTYHAELRIYAADGNGQSFMTSYEGNLEGPSATGGGDPALTCATESTWDETADGGLGAPLTPYSFAAFEQIVTACGTAVAIPAWLPGKTLVSSDGTESSVFFADGTGEYHDAGTLVATFAWTIETGGTHAYLVMTADVDIEPGVTMSFQETHAVLGITGDGTTGTTIEIKAYSEQSNFSDMVRATGIDGDVWQDVLTVQ